MKDKKNVMVFYDCIYGAVSKTKERLKKYFASLGDRKKV